MPNGEIVAVPQLGDPDSLGRQAEELHREAHVFHARRPLLRHAHVWPSRDHGQGRCHPRRRGDRGSYARRRRRPDRAVEVSVREHQPDQRLCHSQGDDLPADRLSVAASSERQGVGARTMGLHAERRETVRHEQQDDSRDVGSERHSAARCHPGLQGVLRDRNASFSTTTCTGPLPDTG